MGGNQDGINSSLRKIREVKSGFIKIGWSKIGGSCTPKMVRQEEQNIVSVWLRFLNIEEYTERFIHN